MMISINSVVLSPPQIRPLNDNLSLCGNLNRCKADSTQVLRYSYTNGPKTEKGLQSWLQSEGARIAQKHIPDTSTAFGWVLNELQIRLYVNMMQ